MNSQYRQKQIYNQKKNGFEFKIVVNASQNVKQLLEIYDLTPAEFLRPFGDFQNESVTFKSSVQKQNPIQNLKINFIDRQAYQPPEKAKYDQLSKKILEDNQPELDFKEEDLLQDDLKDFKPKSDHFPWLEKSAQPLLDLCHYNYELGFLDQPICLMYCIHVKDMKPDKIIEQMHKENQNFYKDVFKYNDEIRDEQGRSQICKTNLIFYDNSNSQQREIAQEYVKFLKNKFPLSLQKAIPLFTNLAQDSLQTNIFQKYQCNNYRTFYQLPDPKYQGNRQSPQMLISNQDFLSIRTTIKEMLKNYVFQWIETRIYILNQSSAELKKTSLSKTISKFWKGNKDEKKGDQYTLNQKEITFRQLADLYFLIDDFEQAAIYYKLLMDELAKKSKIHYASAIEGWSYSIFLSQNVSSLSGQDKGAMLDSLQTAAIIYSQSPGYPCYMVRIALFFVHAVQLFQKCDRYRIAFLWDCSTKLKEKNKESFQSMHLILLEQHAQMYIEIGQIRKFCLHTLLAGYKFGQNGYKKHALYNFIKIYQYYYLVNWAQLKNFIYKYMTKFSCDTGNGEKAIKYIKLNLNNANPSDDDDKHQAVITDTLKLLTTLDQKNLDLLEREIILQEGDPIEIPKLSQHTLDIRLQDEKVHSLQNSKHLILQSANDTLFSQKNQSNVIKLMEQENPYLQYGEILIKKDSRGFLELEKEKKLIKSMGCMCVEQKQKIFEHLKKEIPMNIKNYRLAFTNEVLTVKFQFSNILKQSFELNNFSVIYDFYDENNNFVYTNNYIKELQEKREELLQNIKNKQELQKNLEIAQQQQEETDLLDLDVPSEMLNNDKKVNNQQKCKIWDQAPVQISNQNIIFQNSQSQHIGAKMIPIKPGYMKIKGIQWMFMGIPTQKLFDLEYSYLNKLKIEEQQIQLEVKLENYEQNQVIEMFYCQIQACKLVLTNKGKTAIKNIDMSFIKPSFFGQKYQNLENINLQPGDSHIIELNVRAYERNNFDAKILIKYINDQQSRYLKFLIPIVVKQSTTIKYSIQKLNDHSLINFNIDYSKILEEINKKGSQQINPTQLLQKHNSQQDNDQGDDLLDLNNNNNKFSDLLEEDQNQEYDSKQLDFKIRNIIILDKNWRATQVPLNTRNQIKNKVYVSLQLENQNNHVGEEFSQQPGFNDQINEKSQQNLEESEQNIEMNEEDFSYIDTQESGQNLQQIEQEKADIHKLLGDDEDLASLLTNINNKEQAKKVADVKTLDYDKFKAGFINSNIVKQFVNIDHQIFKETMWHENYDFDHSQLCSFLILYSFKTKGSQDLVYGFYDMPKKKMNIPLFQSLLFKLSATDSFPLKLKSNIPSVVNHDFEQDPICQVKFNLSIKNVYQTEKISFKFQSIDGDQQLKNASDIQFPGFQFEGQVLENINDLQFDETTNIQLTANFTQKGVYNLCRFKFYFYKNRVSNSIINPQEQINNNVAIEEKIYIPFEKEQYIITIQ